VKTKVIPVVTGAIGNHNKKVLNNVNNTPAKQEISEILKTVTLGTEHFTGGNVNVKVHNVYHDKQHYMYVP